MSFVDISTGFSVLVSAFGIILSMQYDRRKLENAARVTVLDNAMRSLLSALKKGVTLRERIQWAAAEETSLSSKEIVQFAFDIRNSIELLECGPFEVWARSNEKQQLSHLKAYAEEWARKFAESLSKDWEAETAQASGATEDVEVPSLDQFMNEIKSEIRKLAKMIGATLSVMARER